MTFTTRTIERDGVRLATRDYGGSGPALVLMHGAGMDQSALEPLVDQLQGSFRVVTFDFRGHGGSDPAPWTLASSVGDLAAVAKAHGLADPAVGGHSLGGMVAAAYAVDHPRCPGAINVDGHGMGRPDQYVGYEEAAVRQWWAEHERKIDRLTQGPGGAVLKGLSFVLRQRPTATPEAARQVMKEVDATDLFAVYRAALCPLLVFNATAQEDRRLMKLLVGKGLPMLAAYRKGLTRDLADLAASKAGVEVAEVDATHMVIRTHPELVARHISDFLHA